MWSFNVLFAILKIIRHFSYDGDDLLFKVCVETFFYNAALFSATFENSCYVSSVTSEVSERLGVMILPQFCNVVIT